MIEARIGGGSLAPPTDPLFAESELVQWLESGRLTLVDSTRQTLSADDWDELSDDVRARALEDFRRVVRGSTKAAVIFLED